MLLLILGVSAYFDSLVHANSHSRKWAVAEHRLLVAKVVQPFCAMKAGVGMAFKSVVQYGHYYPRKAGMLSKFTAHSKHAPAPTLHVLQMSLGLTNFVAHALYPSSKVQGFLHCQHGLMQVILIHIRGSVHSPELVKTLAIVSDVSLDLQCIKVKHAREACFESLVWISTAFLGLDLQDVVCGNPMLACTSFSFKI